MIYAGINSVSWAASWVISQTVTHETIYKFIKQACELVHAITNNFASKFTSHQSWVTSKSQVTCEFSSCQSVTQGAKLFTTVAKHTGS